MRTRVARIDTGRATAAGRNGAAGVLLAVALSLACAGPGSDPGGDADAGGAPASAAAAQGGPLADTAWRLVELQSMDDAIGSVRPDDPSAFTLRLHRDGTASLRLDCNRATGSWRSEPGTSDPSSGHLEFGPLATTRALCPPPHLDERVAAELAWVRSYLLRDGRLHLSLMADGGIQTWEPIAE
jgi:heat shock protein HslJ